MALKLFRRKSKAPVVKEPEKEVKKIAEVSSLSTDVDDGISCHETREWYMNDHSSRNNTLSNRMILFFFFP